MVDPYRDFTDLKSYVDWRYSNANSQAALASLSSHDKIEGPPLTVNTSKDLGYFPYILVGIVGYLVLSKSYKKRR